MGVRCRRAVRRPADPEYPVAGLDGRRRVMMTDPDLCASFAEVADLRGWEDLGPHVPPEPRAKIDEALRIIGERVTRYIDSHISKLRAKDAATRMQAQEVIAHLRPERLLPHVRNLI